MDLDKAIEVLGINRTKDNDIKNMVMALSMFSTLNSTEENERLNAGKYVLKNWPAYSSECNIRRALTSTEEK